VPGQVIEIGTRRLRVCANPEQHTHLGCISEHFRMPRATLCVETDSLDMTRIQMLGSRRGVRQICGFMESSGKQLARAVLSLDWNCVPGELREHLVPAWTVGRSLPGFRKDFFRDVESVVRGRHAAIDGSLEQNFPDFLAGHTRAGRGA